MKKYNIIYADPPWQYRDKRGKDPAWGAMTYPTMPTKEIVQLPIQDLADGNCALFLWTTMPFIPDALEVIGAWGFEYITVAFTWVKMNPSGMGIYSGMGNWTNSNAELCLLGRRGKIKRVAKNIKQIVMSPRMEHSAKPPEVRDRIVSLMGNLPRIELFARECHAGWDVWGNEVESDINIAG